MAEDAHVNMRAGGEMSVPLALYCLACAWLATPRWLTSALTPDLQMYGLMQQYEAQRKDPSGLSRRRTGTLGRDRPGRGDE